MGWLKSMLTPEVRRQIYLWCPVIAPLVAVWFTASSKEAKDE